VDLVEHASVFRVRHPPLVVVITAVPGVVARTPPAPDDVVLVPHQAVCEVGGAPRRAIYIRRAAGGTPPFSVTSHVSCMYRQSSPLAAIAWGCIESTMFSRSSVSTPSPTFGNSIIVMPIEWPVTWPRW